MSDTYTVTLTRRCDGSKCNCSHSLQALQQVHDGGAHMRAELKNKGWTTVSRDDDPLRDYHLCPACSGESKAI